MKRVGEITEIPSVLIKDASYPSPFESGLEYSVPARGGWTIVHVGMLIPEAHEIFVCAAGCLRGVVLSAAEMNMTNRFSTVAVEEHNVINGDMEQLIIDGVSDILDRLPKFPKAVLVYTSCIHHFVGCDLEMCYRVLREKYPSVDFADCYMTPTMRKSGLTPDQLMRRQLYSLLKPCVKSSKHCAIVGNCFSLDEESDIVRMLKEAGWEVMQITECRSYEEYQKMSECVFCISTQAVANVGAKTLAKRLCMKHLYLPVCYEPEKIKRNNMTLAKELGVGYDAGSDEKEANEAMKKAKEMIGSVTLAIDYTFTQSPLGLAKMLVGYGFCVEKIFTDSFSAEEKEEFLWLQKNAPYIEVYPTSHATMRRYENHEDKKVLALGQKAAYFTGTEYFVNIVENGGMYGFDGIKKLARLMEEAFLVPKDTQTSIEAKGLGCESCI